MAKTLASAAITGGANADYLRTYRHVVVPYDTTIEDIIRPGYWAHHSGTLRKGDILDILTEDDSLDVQVRVTGIGIGMVFMRLLRDDPRRLEKPAAKSPEDTSAATVDEVPEGYLVNFAPKHGHRVILKETGMIISKEHKSKADAIAAAFNHSRLADGIAA